CPNGCVRPYQSDIGIVGRSGDKFTLFVGGDLMGRRLNFQLRDLVHRDEIVPTLTPVLEQFKEDRTPGEGFGDFCQRMGLLKLQTMLLPAAEGYTAEDAPAEPTPAPSVAANGVPRTIAMEEPKPALPAPVTRVVAVAGGPSEVALQAPPPVAILSEPRPVETKIDKPPMKRSETFLAGCAGEERADFSYRFNSDGSVRETVVYFYGEDVRAGQATVFDPLRREA